MFLTIFTSDIHLQSLTFDFPDKWLCCTSVRST